MNIGDKKKTLDPFVGETEIELLTKLTYHTTSMDGEYTKVWYHEKMNSIFIENKNGHDKTNDMVHLRPDDLIKIHTSLIERDRKEVLSSDLESTEITLNKMGIRYHKLLENGYTYIQKFGPKDTEGHILVKHPESGANFMVELKVSGQLIDFMEFDENGKIASY